MNMQRRHQSSGQQVSKFGRVSRVKSNVLLEPTLRENPEEHL